tara:strand:+ start:44694 stop:45170 length:477 start_codon:yes stop_codon:yes gene_type:complete
MATPQTCINPETNTRIYVTKTRQFIKNCYGGSNLKSVTLTVDKSEQYGNKNIREERITIRGKIQRKNINNWKKEKIIIREKIQKKKYYQSSKDFKIKMKHNAHTHLEHNGAVPPPEASTRCLYTISGVIDYVKHKERRGILVDENVRHPTCLQLFLLK